MLGIATTFKSKISKVIYFLFSVVSLGLFLVHAVYYSSFKNFFDFESMKYVSEASSYMVDAIKSCKSWVYIITFVEITLIYFSIRFIPKKNKNNFKQLLFVVPIFLLLHLITPLFLGKSVTTWDAWRKPRNIYNIFNDANRSMQISGMYEYNVRDIYFNYFKKQTSESDDSKALLENKFSNSNIEHNNKYTGMFENKNVIFLQLESIDNFLVTKEIMPTLYDLKNNSINFNNHYSFVSGGGSTFNSEYMVNTGYTTPIKLNQNAYTYNKNDYTYSLPNLLKDKGYTVNAFHMNNASYYSRDVNYKSFGYDSFNSLKDNNKYTDNSYWLDTELINDKEFNKLIFNTENPDEKFMSYIITYSAHMPYQADKGVCSLLVDDTTKVMSEYDCLKLQARETDNMIKLLMDNLEEKGLIDNTILVLFSDHYLYTLSDKTLLDQFKETDNNLINHTAWMVWSNDMKRKNINTVTSQLNIMPTMLNLLGLEYHPNYYLMDDALDDNHESLVFFNDYSWYDGNVYVSNGIVTNNKVIIEDELNRKNELVNTLIKTNDAVISNDYFKNISKKDTN
jgi:phosphoglycerol transferase MdoB-like AlkP superfamily enzyme